MKACTKIDSEILTDPEILSLLDRSFLCFGVNINTTHGKYLAKLIESKALPHISIIKAPAEQGKHLIMSELEGNQEITKENLLKELTKAVNDYKDERAKEAINSNSV